MNFEQEIRRVLKDGKAVIGKKSIKKGLLRGKLKMVIVANNASEESKEDFKRYAQLSDVKYYEYPESSRELGYACAKPFPISSVGVADPGSSNILQAE